MLDEKIKQFLEQKDNWKEEIILSKKKEIFNEINSQLKDIRNKYFSINYFFQNVYFVGKNCFNKRNINKKEFESNFNLYHKKYNQIDEINFEDFIKKQGLLFYEEKKSFRENKRLIISGKIFKKKTQNEIKDLIDTKEKRQNIFYNYLLYLGLEKEEAHNQTYLTKRGRKYGIFIPLIMKKNKWADKKIFNDKEIADYINKINKCGSMLEKYYFENENLRNKVKIQEILFENTERIKLFQQKLQLFQQIQKFKKV